MLYAHEAAGGDRDCSSGRAHIFSTCSSKEESPWPRRRRKRKKRSNRPDRVIPAATEAREPMGRTGGRRGVPPSAKQKKGPVLAPALFAVLVMLAHDELWVGMTGVPCRLSAARSPWRRH